MQFITHLPGSSALVLDSPHSGTAYPPDFLPACELQTLRQAEDTHVEKLYDFAPALGVHWIEAHFPRSYLDVNRNTTEVDVTLFDAPWPGPVETDPKILSKVRLGKGLIWRTTDDGVPIYGRKLAVAEVQARIEQCWTPYHAAVAQAIDAAHQQHGYSIHINCHSMPAIASSQSTDFPGENLHCVTLSASDLRRLGYRGHAFFCEDNGTGEVLGAVLGPRGGVRCLISGSRTDAACYSFDICGFADGVCLQ